MNRRKANKQNTSLIYEKIEVVLDNTPVIGQRVISGKARLDQYVLLGDQCIPDLHGYLPSEKDTKMLAVAKQILFELAKGRSISQRHRDCFGV